MSAHHPSLFLSLSYVYMGTDSTLRGAPTNQDFIQKDQTVQAPVTSLSPKQTEEGRRESVARAPQVGDKVLTLDTFLQKQGNAGRHGATQRDS